MGVYEERFNLCTFLAVLVDAKEGAWGASASIGTGSPFTRTLSIATERDVCDEKWDEKWEATELQLELALLPH